MLLEKYLERMTAEHAMLLVLIGLSCVFLIEPAVQDYPADARIFPQMTATVVLVGSVLLLVRSYLPAPVHAFVAESVAITDTDGAPEEVPGDEQNEPTTAQREEHPPRLGEEYGIEINDTLFMVGISTVYLAAGWAAGFLVVTLPFVLAYTLWFRIPWRIGLTLGVVATAVIWFFMEFLVLPFDRGEIFDFSPYLPLVTDVLGVAPGRLVGTVLAGVI